MMKMIKNKEEAHIVNYMHLLNQLISILLNNPKLPKPKYITYKWIQNQSNINEIIYNVCYGCIYDYIKLNVKNIILLHYLDLKRIFNVLLIFFIILKYF